MMHGRRRQTKHRNAKGQIVDAKGHILHARLRNSPLAPGASHDAWKGKGKGKA